MQEQVVDGKWLRSIYCPAGNSIYARFVRVRDMLALLAFDMFASQTRKNPPFLSQRDISSAKRISKPTLAAVISKLPLAAIISNEAQRNENAARDGAVMSYAFRGGTIRRETL